VSNKVVHFEVIGKDGKKLQEFFSALFGWTIDANNPMNYGVVDASQAGIRGGIAPGVRPVVTFYVEVDDLQAYLKKAESLGGMKVMEPMEIPGGQRIAVFSDPEGNVIGLVGQ